MPPFATANTIYYEPITTTTSTTSPTVYTTVGPASVSFIYKDTEEKMREYCDKVDRHVDELEEDIEFLNTKREEQEQVIAALLVNDTEYNKRIEELEKEKMHLESYVNWLETRIGALEEKIK